MLRVETRGRARALQLLYAWEATGRSVASLLPGLARLVGPRQREALELAEALATGVAAEAESLDACLSQAAENWRLDRMSRVDRNILRIGSYELCHATVPPRVAIDQALWLAHRFGTPESPAFINGVLDRVARGAGRL
jgi:N utilization substance protein B